MEIKTKYNIGDKVYFINSNKRIDNGTVINIDISVTRRSLAFSHDPKITIKYIINGELIEETRCFKTKEELIESL